MATHNRASTLDRAITSVQRQTMSDWELIVVDDGSTDSSAELLRQLADPRIRVITHERNRGVCAAKNTGLDAMRGEWFTTLDSDDEIVPEALEAMLACAARTGATAITCNCRDAETGLLTGRGPGSDCRLSPEATARCRGEFWGLTRSELLGELRFDERLPGYEETVFLLINREARRFYLHEALRVYHTEGSDRVTKASGASSLAQKVDVHVALGEDHDYLCELGRVDFAAFARTYARIVIARCLRPFIGVHRRGSLPAR